MREKERKNEVERNEFLDCAREPSCELSKGGSLGIIRLQPFKQTTYVEMRVLAVYEKAE